MEGTTAGLAAGVAAKEGISIQEYTIPTPRLLVKRRGAVVDMALIDVVVSNDLFVGTRAIWEISRIQEIFSSRGRPSNVGFSSIVGCFRPLDPERAEGLHLLLGEEGRDGTGQKVMAPIAPGLIRAVSIHQAQALRMGEPLQISHYPCTLALDGEREIFAGGEQAVEVELTPDGPFVLDHERILEHAAREGLFQVEG
jgi:hypothetical protein